MANRRVIAGVSGILFGSVGLHKLYTRQYKMFILYLVFFWTFVPMMVGFIEGIRYLFMTDEGFNEKYPKQQ